MIMSQPDQDQSPSASRRRPSSLLQANSDHYGEGRQASSSSANPESGSSVDRNAAGGDERRNLQRSRYWRVREWAPVTTDGASGEDPKKNENPGAKKVENDSKGTTTKKYDDEPPGFRWVEIRIVAKKKRKPEAGATSMGEDPEDNDH